MHVWNISLLFVTQTHTPNCCCIGLYHCIVLSWYQQQIVEQHTTANDTDKHHTEVFVHCLVSSWQRPPDWNVLLVSIIDICVVAYQFAIDMPWASRRMCLTFTRLISPWHEPSVHSIKISFFLRAMIQTISKTTWSSHYNVPAASYHFTHSTLSAIINYSYVYTRAHTRSHENWV